MKSGIPTIEQVHKEEAEKLKVFCAEHFGENACLNCHSSVAQWNCINHPKFGKAEDETTKEVIS